MNKKGTLRTVIGDVTSPQRTDNNEVVIIPHCCNDLGIMGAGVALALRNKWPEVYQQYANSFLHGRVKLGDVTFIYISDNIYGNYMENPRIQTIICNMIGQHGTVSKNNPKPVKYYALAEAMRKIATMCINIKETWNWNGNHKPVIHCPKFGSDLAGGKWEFILDLIREIWLEHGIDVVVYEFEERRIL